MRCCCCCGVMFEAFIANWALFEVGVINCCCIGIAPVELGMPVLYGEEEYGV